MENEWGKFIERTRNFHWNISATKKWVTNLEELYKKIYDSTRHVFESKNNYDNQNREALLDSIFSEIYTTITMFFFDAAYFLKGSPLYDNVYKACFFISLCMFLHETHRAKSLSLKQFIYANSLDYYNDNNSEHFCPFNAPSDELLTDIDTLRKRRHRLLSSRPVYNKRSEWAAMSQTSEHEWSFLYVLEVEDDILRDTYKRIGNLYNDISSACSSQQDRELESTIKKAYEKFLSKLNKINYEDYLNLQKVIFDHICENKKFYGINLYRIERELRPYTTTNEVNQLLACETILDEEAVLDRSAILRSIDFPKVYSNFASIPIVSDIENTSLRFLGLRDFITPISCLLIDELVEKNYLGEDWYDFLCELTNKLAKDIFYNPKDIDYTITPKSQESFMKILSASVQRAIYENANIIIS